jgi:anthranilate phosphoribosyltransferase
MERDYAAIIAAMRVKAKSTEYAEERDALLEKAKELEEKTKPKDTFLIVITGEDPKWRHSYLWPTDSSPIMNPYHPWEDTEE